MRSGGEKRIATLPSSHPFGMTFVFFNHPFGLWSLMFVMGFLGFFVLLFA